MRNGGFTLMELLVSLALVGIMTLLLYGAMDFGGRAWSRSESRAARENAIRLVWQQLNDFFLQARLPFSGEPRSQGRFIFRGDEKSVEFVTSMGRETGAGLYLVRITQQRHGDRIDLVLRRWLLHPEIVAGGAPIPPWIPQDEADDGAHSKRGEQPRSNLWYAESVLASALLRANFSFYTGASTNGWSRRWKSGQKPPPLVRLQVEDGRGAWPEMVFELPPS